MTAHLLQGDCIEQMKNLPDNSIDAIITDPPYGTTACKWDSVIPFEPMWEQLKRITKLNGAIVLFGSQPFTSALIVSNPKMFKYEWVWKKNAGSNFAQVKYQPMKEHENLLVFSQEKTVYYPQMQERSESGKKMIKTGVKSGATRGDGVYSGANKGYDNSKQNPEMRVPSSVQNFNRERGFHPTQKPVALMEYLIKTYTNEGETVLDFTAGSGTTGVACVNLNRNFVGIEKDPRYFEIAKERIAEAERIRNGEFFIKKPAEPTLFDYLMEEGQDK